MWPDVVLLLATKCLYWGWGWGHMGVGVHLTKHQPDSQADQMSCWPVVVPLLTTRCVYWGGEGPTGGIGGDIWKNQDSVLQSPLENSRLSIEHCRPIEHELRSMEPKLVPLLATKCLYLVGHWGGIGEWWVGGYMWQNISMTHRLMKCHADLQ